MPGDRVRASDGRWMSVESVRETGQTEIVYNFRVSEWHTYFVGDPAWGFDVWVHSVNMAGDIGKGKKLGKNPRNPDPLQQEEEIIKEQERRRKQGRKDRREAEESGKDREPKKGKAPIDDIGRSRGNAKKDLERHRREQTRMIDTWLSDTKTIHFIVPQSTQRSLAVT